MNLGTLYQQGRFRRLACCCVLLATPGFIWCGLQHFCMDGHMAQPPYWAWEKASDVTYILLLGMGAFLAARSNIRKKRWFIAILLLMLFPRFAIGAAVLDFLAIPPAWIIAIRGLRSQ